MAVLEPPFLPEYLYRYRAFTRDGTDYFDKEIEAIKTPYIWCADFNTLNDPMEGLYIPTRLLKKKTTYGRVVDAILNGKTEVGIAGLSDTRDSELMWAHYAQKSTGMCIQFSARKLVRMLPRDASVVRLSYDTKPPHISTADARDMPVAVKKIFSQKKLSWAYEREWRVLGKKEKNPISAKECITRIYLGSRISSACKDDLLAALRTESIEIRQMNVDGYEYTSNLIRRRSPTL